MALAQRIHMFCLQISLAVAVSHCGTVKPAQPLKAPNSTVSTGTQDPSQNATGATGATGPTGPSQPASFFFAINKGPADKAMTVEFAGYSTGESGSDGRPVFVALPAPKEDTATFSLYELNGAAEAFHFVVGCRDGLGKWAYWQQVSRSQGESEVRCYPEARGPSPARTISTQVNPGSKGFTQLSASTTSETATIACPGGICANPTLLDIGGSPAGTVYDVLIRGQLGATRSFAVLREQTGDVALGNADSAELGSLARFTVNTGGRTATPTGFLLSRFATAFGVFAQTTDDRPAATASGPTFIEFSDIAMVPSTVLASGDRHQIEIQINGDNGQLWTIKQSIAGAVPATYDYRLVDAPAPLVTFPSLDGYLGLRVDNLTNVDGKWTEIRTEQVESKFSRRTTSWTIQLDPAAQKSATGAVDLADVVGVPGFKAEYLHLSDKAVSGLVSQIHTMTGPGERSYQVDAKLRLSYAPAF